MPLTEDCGIVEWVPHTTGLRHCCQAAYIAEGLYAGQKTNSAIKKVYDNYPVCHSLRPPSKQISAGAWAMQLADIPLRDLCLLWQAVPF